MNEQSVAAAVTPMAILKNPIHCLAFGFGSGLAPKAPGTFGTLMALPLYACLTLLSWQWYALVVIIAFVLGVYLCGKTADDLGVHDHPGIVWDEFVGYWVAMFLAPSGLAWWLVGFVLFRLFDIWKPWPIRVLDEKMTTGMGIMLDDVLAGVYALLMMQLINFML